MSKIAKEEKELGEDLEEKKEELLEEKNNEAEQKYLRALADYQNLLKQSSKEKMEFAKYALEDFLNQMLPVYDHLKLSLKNLKPEEEKNAWVEGVRCVLKEFKSVLENNGIEEIKTEGEKFDHNEMEALDGEGEMVDKEVMPGYKLNGKIIKIAKVIVKK